MPISALPTPPSRSDSPQDFSDRADALLGALPGFVTEANALQSDVNAKESSASSHATVATDKAAEAQGYATTATTKASEAAASAVAAAAAASNAEIAFDSFDDKYLGSKSSDPAADNDGNALLTGALYWNTTVGAVRVWNGSAWLSMAADASIVDFQQAGAGAVVRTAQDKMREWVSVKDFGAVGDGVTDDTSAIQSAIIAHDRVVIPRGTYLINTAIVQRQGTEVIFDQGAAVKLTAPIYHAWFFSGGASVTTRLIRPVIDCNLQPGANGLGIGGSGLGLVQNIYIENPVVLNARREPNSGATYSGGGRGVAIETDVRNVQIIAPRFENCTAGFSTQPYTAKPTQGLLIVAPIAINCMHYAEFFDLPDAGTVTPSGEMGGAVILGGYAKNVGIAQSDYYSGTGAFDAATDTGAIMCERARWVNWRGFQIYNEASYGSIGSVVRGAGANCVFEGTFAGNCNAITDATFSNMLLPIPAGQAVPLRNMQMNITHSGAYNYIHRYTLGSNANARGLQLRHRAYQAPSIGLLDTTDFPGDAYLEWFNFSTGEGFSGSLSSWSGYSIAGSARLVNDRVRISQAVTLNPTSNQAIPSVSSEANIYIRYGKLVIQYNDGGTTRYKYLDLSGVGVTWVHSTTAP